MKTGVTSPLSSRQSEKPMTRGTTEATPSTELTLSRSLVSRSEGSSKHFAPFGSTQRSAEAWSIMVVTMRPKPRNRPIWIITSTTEKTIPTRVATKRSRSWKRLRDASVRTSDMAAPSSRLIGDGLDRQARLAAADQVTYSGPDRPARHPAQRQRRREDEPDLAERVEVGAEQGVLQPQHEHVVHEVDAVSVCGKAAKDTIARPHPAQRDRDECERAGCRGDGKGQRRSKPIGEGARVPIRQSERRKPAPRHEAGDGRREPGQPATRDGSLAAEHAAIDAIAADGEPGEEVDDVVQRPAELEGERAEIGPLPWPKDHGEQDVAERRERRQTAKQAERMDVAEGNEPAQYRSPGPRKSVQRCAGRAEQQQLPQEPLWTRRPHRQCAPVLPECSE